MKFKTPQSLSFFWTIPVLAALLGTVFLVMAYWDYRREIKDTEAMARAHADSVALLIKEGAREAAASTSLIYGLAEDQLIRASELLLNTYANHEDSPPVIHLDLAISLVKTADNVYEGNWGTLEEDTRRTFLDWMFQSEPDLLIDDGPLERLGLACISHSVAEASTAIVCRHAKELSMLRKEIGIGPLLKGVIQQDVKYVALQDSEGVLAQAPATAHLTAWQDDPFLNHALERPSSIGLSRIRSTEHGAVFEGLIPFQMADESTVILRVGIDGSNLQQISNNAKNNFYLMVILVTVMVIIIGVFARFASGWQKRTAAIERLLAKQEQERKHWETIGQMAATVAHEVRNPLNTVEMIPQRLKAEFQIAPDEKEEFDELLGILRSESKRVERVVTDFLKLGKPLKLVKEKVSLSTLLDDAVAALRIRAHTESKQLELEVQYLKDVIVDVDRFHQVIKNLAGNALDAVSPDTGRIVIHAEAIANNVKIEIRDNGPGLSEDQLTEVMKPFVSYKSKGTGLGLPLCRRIVETHGGTLTIGSKPDHGTTATITIPTSSAVEGG